MVSHHRMGSGKQYTYSILLTYFDGRYRSWWGICFSGRDCGTTKTVGDLPVLPKFESSRVLRRSESTRLNLCYKQVSHEATYINSTPVGYCNQVVSGGQVGSHNGLTLTDRTIKRILRAQETIFKYGTLIPRNDAEARRSPEAIRWMSGQQLEWIRLHSAKTFETQWTWDKVREAYPSYKKVDIGHMFFIYDYKFSG